MRVRTDIWVSTALPVGRVFGLAEPSMTFVDADERRYLPQPTVAKMTVFCNPEALARVRITP